MGTVAEVRRPKPFLFPEFCKGCGRCITACQKHSIAFSDHINPKTGVVPVEIDLDTCNGCGLCFEACPEPYGLLPRPAGDADFGMLLTSGFRWRYDVDDDTEAYLAFRNPSASAAVPIEVTRITDVQTDDPPVAV